MKSAGGHPVGLRTRLCAWVTTSGVRTISAGRSRRRRKRWLVKRPSQGSGRIHERLREAMNPVGRLFRSGGVARREHLALPYEDASKRSGLVMHCKSDERLQALPAEGRRTGPSTVPFVFMHDALPASPAHAGRRQAGRSLESDRLPVTENAFLFPMGFGSGKVHGVSTRLSSPLRGRRPESPQGMSARPRPAVPAFMNVDAKRREGSP